MLGIEAVENMWKVSLPQTNARWIIFGSAKEIVHDKHLASVLVKHFQEIFRATTLNGFPIPT